MSLRWTLFRTVSAAGVLAGVLLLIRPDEALARLAPEFPPARRWVVRLLGARLVAQHAAVLAAPSAALLRAAGGIDLLHAATMLPLLRSPRYGRVARISGAVAASYGTWASVAGQMGR